MLRNNQVKQIVVEALQEVLAVPGPFNCNHCPRNSDKERGAWCPAWGTILLNDVVPGKGMETKVVEACYFDRMEKWHEGINNMARMNIESLNKVTVDVEEHQGRISAEVAQFLTAFAEAHILTAPQTKRPILLDQDDKVNNKEENT